MIRRWDWRLLRQVPRLAREGAWDVLHIQYQPGAFQLRGAIHLLPSWIGHLGQRHRRPPAVVTTFHDLRVPYLFPKAGPLRRAAVRHLARSCQGIIAAEGDDLRQLRAWTARRRRPPAIGQVSLGNALDVPPPEGFEREAWRGRLGLAPDSSLIGHFGFVNRTKGVDVLVQALALLAAGGRDAHLLMIGDPLGSSDPTNREYLEGVRRQVAQAGLEGRVRWTGFCDPPQVAGWLRCLDVCALPFSEGASLRRTSIQAAWAHGVPLLTTTRPDQTSWPEGGAARRNRPPWRSPAPGRGPGRPPGLPSPAPGAGRGRTAAGPPHVLGAGRRRDARPLPRSARAHPGRPRSPRGPGRQRRGSRLSRVPHSAPSKTRVSGIRTR